MIVITKSEIEETHEGKIEGVISILTHPWFSQKEKLQFFLLQFLCEWFVIFNTSQNHMILISLAFNIIKKVYVFELYFV
jgi:hypothetical protein